MGNRVLLGKNTNTNHGFGSTPAYGLWISRSTGKNVLNCSRDQLSFSTTATTTGSSTAFSDVGQFQIMPASVNSDGTVETVAVTTIAAGASITFNFTQLYSFSSAFASFALLFRGSGSSGSSAGANSTASVVSTSNTTSTQTSIGNSSSSSVTIRTALWNPISTSAFF